MVGVSVTVARMGVDKVIVGVEDAEGTGAASVIKEVQLLSNRATRMKMDILMSFILFILRAT